MMIPEKGEKWVFKVEIESNKTRLGNIPKYLEMISKQVSRLKKGIPSLVERDSEIAKMVVELNTLEQQNVRNMAAGKQLIEQCDLDLANFKV